MLHPEWDDSHAPKPWRVRQPGPQRFPRTSFQELGLLHHKVWKANEKLRLQFRGEFFNLLNHPNYDVFTMGTDLGFGPVGDARATPDVGNANPVIGSGGSRHIQLGFKMIW
jgi:hypothetical protein